jgi:phage-related minor tail protein
VTTIGYATLQIIPSLDGVSKSVEKQLGGALDGKKFGKSFGKDIASGVKASEADVKRAMDAYSKLYDKQADALGKVKTAQAQLNAVQKSGNEARIVAATERVEKAKRDEARALRDARDGYREYESAAKRAANAGDGVGGGLLDKLKGLGGKGTSAGSEAAAGFVDGFGGPIAALGTKAGPIGLALAAAAGLALVSGGIIAKNVLAGMEQEQQSANVAAKLGLSPQQMKPIAEASAQAYASNFGESVAANMDTARAAIQSGLLDPNATKADVQAMVQQLSTVSDVMGEEIPATARAAQQAIRTGLAGNATQAFDLFTKAQQSGLNVSEDFLDTITEYGTQFRKLGLSGPEAIGLINQAVKGGARDTDVAADALKEFSIRAVDGSKTTVDGFTSIGLNADDMAAKFAQGGQSAHDAFGQVLTAVRDIHDPVEQSRVAVELFGTQAEDLGGALSTFDLSHAVDQLGAVDGAAQRASDTMGNTATGSVESAKRSIEVAADGMQKSLADAFGPGLEQAAAWVSAHQGEITGFFETAANVATEFGGAVLGLGGAITQGMGVVVGAIGDTVGFVLDGFETLLGGASRVAAAFGADGLASDLRDASTELGVVSDQFHGWGEGMKTFGGDLINAGFSLHDFQGGLANTAENINAAKARTQELANVIGALPGGKQIDISAIVVYKDTAGIVIPPDQLRAPVRAPAVPGDTYRGPGRAAGGPISGPGGPTSDLIPIWASNGEHMLTASDVQAMGGQAGVYAFRNMLHRSGGGSIFPMAQIPWPPGKINKTGDRAGNLPNLDSGFNPSQRALPWLLDPDSPIPSGPPGVPLPPTDDDILFPDSQPWWMRKWLEDHPPSSWKNPHRNMLLGAGLGFAGGGAIGPDVKVAGELVGTAYSQAKRNDCSGMVARVIDRTLGMPESGLMSTKNAADWLAARGFKKGIGGPGQISVGWYDHGPNPNDGHMAMTLSDGSNAEAGGGVGDIFQIGGGAAGASNPEFDQHMYLPTVYGEGPAGSGSASAFAGGSAVAAMSGGGGGDLGGFTKAISSSSGGGGGGGGGGGSLSLPSSLSGFGSFAGGKLGDLSKLGEAAGSIVDGQVASALDVFGVPSTPGWLKGISQLVGGISIGGGDGAALPLAANPKPYQNVSADDPGNMHGGRAGQAPGPTYNITARDTEDAFVKAQRVEREKAAAKLSRF